MNAATESLTVRPSLAAALPEDTGPTLIRVDLHDLRPTPPPPPRTATVPAVRIGVVLAALGGLLVVAAMFVPSWYAVREITASPQQLMSQQGTGANSQSFYLFRVMPDVREQAAVGWASTRHEKRTILVVALALGTEALALMSAVSIYLWRPLVSFAGMAAAALPALAVADLLNIANVISRRINAPSGNFRNSTPITTADFRVMDPHPGLGMIVLFAGAGVVVVGALMALIGGQRSRVLAQMPA